MVVEFWISSLAHQIPIPCPLHVQETKIKTSYCTFKTNVLSAEEMFMAVVLKFPRSKNEVFTCSPADLGNRICGPGKIQENRSTCNSFLADVKLYTACEGGQGSSLMEDTKWAVNGYNMWWVGISSCALQVSVLRTGYNKSRPHRPSTHSSRNDLLIARGTMSLIVM